MRGSHDNTARYSGKKSEQKWTQEVGILKGKVNYYRNSQIGPNFINWVKAL